MHEYFLLVYKQFLSQREKIAFIIVDRMRFSRCEHQWVNQALRMVKSNKQVFKAFKH
jgi:hypothetical protein